MSLINSIFKSTGVIKQFGLGIPIGLPGLIPKLAGEIGIRIRFPEQQEESKISEGTFLAAPKKKVSLRKRRQRQLAGNKQIKELYNLNRCPSCGHVKRAHTLCMNCVKEIQRVWKLKDKADIESSTPKDLHYNEKDLSFDDKRVLYPGKRESQYEKKLKNKEEYLYRRPKTLPYSKIKSSSQK